MSRTKGERGAVLITLALFLLVLFLFLALAVDVGLGYVERRKVQAITDAASLAAMQVMSENATDAQILAVIRDYVLVQNPLGSNEQRTYTAQWLLGSQTAGTVGVGARPTGVSGILVTVKGSVPTFFARLAGIPKLDAVARGGGGYSPLDVVLVLDKSGSMDDDSCFLHHANSGYSLRAHFKDSSLCNSVSTGDGLSSSNCANCKGTYKSKDGCYWPDGAKMTSAVYPYCGTNIHQDKKTCEACKGVWTPPPEPMADLKQASIGFVNLVQAELGSSNPHVGLVSYSTSATLDVKLTGTMSTVTSGINNLQSLGYTNCEDGLYQARLELTTSGRQRWTSARVMIFMSDGNANRCRGSTSTCAAAKTKAIAEAERAAAAGITIYTIGLGEEADTITLQQIAAVGGGVYMYAPSSADLQACFQEMFRKIRGLRLVE